MYPLKVQCRLEQIKCLQSYTISNSSYKFFLLNNINHSKDLEKTCLRFFSMMLLLCITVNKLKILAQCSMRELTVVSVDA